MSPIEYRVITGRRDADVKSLAAITVLDNNEPEKLAESVDFFRDELEHLDPGQRLLIGAFAGMELAGFCRFQMCPRLAVWWCRGLEVVPEWQGQGIGSELLMAGIAEFAKRGATDIRSDTWGRNLPSQATHVKAGFRLMGTSGEDFDGRWRDDQCFYQWESSGGGVPARDWIAHDEGA